MHGKLAWLKPIFNNILKIFVKFNEFLGKGKGTPLTYKGKGALNLLTLKEGKRDALNLLNFDRLQANLQLAAILLNVLKKLKS